jgi:putative tryptophan/tyrosine transport system substrate-binding protein
MRRREFIAGLGTAAAWPVVARAQQPDRLRRVGVLVPGDLSQARVAAFLEGMQQLGWIDGRNVRIDARLGASDADSLREHVRELLALGPDVVMAYSSNAVPALLQLTHTVPIVFAAVADPVGAGYVDSLARPGGNVTGFAGFEFAMGGKWLGLLKEIAPLTTRVAVLRDPTIAAGPAEFGAIQAVAPSLSLELRPLDVRDAGEIERTIPAFAQRANGGLVVTAGIWASIHRKLIITLAAHYKLPAVYNSGYFATDGGLIGYGPDYSDLCRRAAGYVDRILKGEKPADLPVAQPTKFELVINLKTAAALGLTIPETLLATADEVIQ